MRTSPRTPNKTTAGLLLAIAVPVLLLFVSSHTLAGHKPSKVLPIENWVNTQGTYCLSPEFDCAAMPTECLLFVPPFENFFGWGAYPPPPNDPGYYASFDYAGIVAKMIHEERGIDLGTSFSGHVRERPLNDGRAEVKVILHVENALAWAQECCDFAVDPVLFGARSTDVLAGADPTLGNFFMNLTFINTMPGAPLPDFMQLVYCPEPGQEIRYIRVSASAFGPLTENFGVPNGTPGKLTVSETALFHTPFMGAVGDAFPAEHVILREVGGGTHGDVDGEVVGLTPSSWIASPNPLTNGARLSFSYQVPEGGANVSVSIYSVTGRRIATLAEGFQAAGVRSLTWNGRLSSGDKAVPGVYFLRATVADAERSLRVVVMP